MVYLRKNFRLESKASKGAQSKGTKLGKQQQFNLFTSRWRAQKSRSMHMKKEVFLEGERDERRKKQEGRRVEGNRMESQRKLGKVDSKG